MILDVIYLQEKDPFKQRRILEKETKISVRDLFIKLDIPLEDIVFNINRTRGSLDQICEEKYNPLETSYYLIVATTSNIGYKG